MSNVCCGPSCEYNKGVICPEAGRSCNHCGWNPVVADLRKIQIHCGNLKRNKRGSLFLPRSKGGAECAK